MNGGHFTNLYRNVMHSVGNPWAEFTFSADISIEVQ